MSEPILIYDGDCAFCTTSAQALRRWLRSDATVEPWQFLDLGRYGVDRDRASYEALWVSPSGRVYGGAQAFARWLIHSGGAWRPIGALMTVPPVRWLAHGVYRVIAHNRHRLPGGTPACAIRPVAAEDAAPAPESSTG